MVDCTRSILQPSMNLHTKTRRERKVSLSPCSVPYSNFLSWLLACSTAHHGQESIDYYWKKHHHLCQRKPVSSGPLKSLQPLWKAKRYQARQERHTGMHRAVDAHFLSIPFCLTNYWFHRVVSKGELVVAGKGLNGWRRNRSSARWLQRFS